MSSPFACISRSPPLTRMRWTPVLISSMRFSPRSSDGGAFSAGSAPTAPTPPHFPFRFLNSWQIPIHHPRGDGDRHRCSSSQSRGDGDTRSHAVRFCGAARESRSSFLSLKPLYRWTLATSVLEARPALGFEKSDHRMTCCSQRQFPDCDILVRSHRSSPAEFWDGIAPDELVRQSSGKKQRPWHHCHRMPGPPARPSGAEEVRPTKEQPALSEARGRTQESGGTNAQTFPAFPCLARPAPE